MQMTSKERVMAAFAREPVDRAPVINPTSIITLESMNSVGLKFPDVHLDAYKMAAAAATGRDILGFDSVMPKFSVVHSAAAMGAEVDWGQGNSMPVIRRHPIKDPDQVKIPADILDRAPVKVVLDAIKLLRKRYGNEIAIIGKVFGPWTTAYNMCGTENFLIETALDPDTAVSYLEAFAPLPVMFAEAQFEAGADIILWGDHISGDLCSPLAYQKLLLPIHQRINDGWLKKKGPVILHACGYTLDRIDLIRESGFEAFHFDSRNDTKMVLEKAADKILLTGAVNNADVLLKGKPEDVKKQVFNLLDAGIALISPECAVPVMTPNANLIAIVDAAIEHAQMHKSFN
jgi:[methyl-Co(III) methanol-specific corrinoid protein]:coenzyme M methyltransferase